MEAKTKTAHILIGSKPINFYVYSLLLIIIIFIFGSLSAYFKQYGRSTGIETILVGIYSAVALVGCYYLRIVFIRHNKSLRKKALQIESDDEAIKLLFGTYGMGILSLSICALTFYITIQPLLKNL
ncbi:MAG: hypothetical protein HRU21_12240 [Pseudomonadales bacterium]|nr:hypothetical protein [Pseudomonadales bacterium]